MVEFDYKEIIEQAELIEYELDNLKRKKDKYVPTPFNVTELIEDKEPKESPEMQRMEARIRLLEGILRKYDEVLSGIKLKFVSNDQKGNQWNQPTIPQNQQKQ